ncbi:hypothetical protein PL75_03355 [Neisseria arctica]|uniref:Uncharacterized protein n=1 Tax=Neisseria arctica TaxID=1470200 RepID=A0A0J1C4N0_9NEIS|nr:hypothetical protein [Neisseria arctica]KLT73273.1 hypothetical protein PL75_03355 [Neisseria arctica]UOO87470.1 hypothetical protein LVJ86_04295 [Neisseria arctica]
MNETESQSKQILNHLQSGKGITKEDLAVRVKKLVQVQEQMDSAMKSEDVELSFELFQTWQAVIEQDAEAVNSAFAGLTNSDLIEIAIIAAGERGEDERQNWLKYYEAKRYYNILANKNFNQQNFMEAIRIFEGFYVYGDNIRGGKDEC